MKHKHHDAIVAWAGGAEIQHRAPNSTEWKDNADPAWVEDYSYRIKPSAMSSCDLQKACAEVIKRMRSGIINLSKG